MALKEDSDGSPTDSSSLNTVTMYLYSVTSVGLVSPQRRRGRRCLLACAAVWPVPWCGLPSRGPAEVGTPDGSTGTVPCGRRFPSHPCRLCRTGRCRTEWRKLEGHSDDQEVQTTYLFRRLLVTYFFDFCVLHIILLNLHTSSILFCWHQCCEMAKS